LTAFDAFDSSASELKIGNARALMWLSQLAYESHKDETVQKVSQSWKFVFAKGFHIGKISLAAAFETCGFIGERPDAVILAFTGTDPGVWQNLATDFTLRPHAQTDIHEGFWQAADAAKDQLAEAVERSKTLGKPLFITGHSRGAALASLAALAAYKKDAAHVLGAVYLFGAPRTGGTKFQGEYNAALGPITYRFVHGIDVVSRVPPSNLGFCHIGRVLQCAAGAKFNGATPLSSLGSDEPLLSGELGNIFARTWSDLLKGRIFAPEGSGPFGPFFRFLPPAIRDHLQDSYWKALS
jgi:hypothetical protein